MNNTCVNGGPDVVTKNPSRPWTAISSILERDHHGLFPYLQCVRSNDSFRATIVVDFVLYYGSRDTITGNEV